MKKRTALASPLGKGRIRVASRREGHKGIRVLESYCVSPNSDRLRIVIKEIG